MSRHRLEVPVSRARRLLAAAVGMVALVVPVSFVAAPAGAEDPAPRPVALVATPALLQYLRAPHDPNPSPVPVPLPTLTLAARLGEKVPLLPPVPGETLIFSIGTKPTAARPGGGIEICRATTDADGWATCAPVISSVLATLGLGAWVAHPANSRYGFAVQKVELIGEGCSVC
jgi:hypothetical protein